MEKTVTEQPKSIKSPLSSSSERSEPIDNDLWQLGQWAHVPNSVDNCHPSLRALSSVEKVIIIKQFKYNQLMTGYESDNRYLIQNKDEENIYYAVEKSDNCSRACCCYCGNRSFEITLYDKHMVNAICLKSPLRVRCGCMLFPCCLQKMIVKGPEKHTIDVVEEMCHPFKTEFSIKDEITKRKLKVSGPYCTCNCFGDDIHFNVLKMFGDGAMCGEIIKKPEFISGGHIIHVSFPKDLYINLKISMIATALLIDYTFYEHPIHVSKYHPIIPKSASDE